MNNNKEMTLKSFQLQLNIYYSQDNDEQAADQIVEKFSTMASSFNKDKNPFFLKELLRSIKTRNVPLSELVGLDGTIIKEIFQEARQKAIVIQQELSRDNNSPEDIRDPMKNNLGEQKKLTEENIVQAFLGYTFILEKYDNDWEKLISQGSQEEINYVTQASIDLGLMQEGDDILVQWQSNNFEEIHLTPEQHQDEKIIRRLREFGVIVKEDSSLSADRENKEQIIQYTKGTHEVKCLVEVILKERPNATPQEIQENLSKIEDNIFIKEYFNHTSIEKFSAFCQNMTINIRAQNKAIKQQSLADIEKENGEMHILDNGTQAVITPETIEHLFDLEFALMDDPALVEQGREEPEEVNVAETIGVDIPENNETLTSAQIPEAVIDELPEESYETPTIKVEKKGLAKLFDRLQQSKNPLARLITGKMGKNQKLLDSADSQKNETQYEEKPSKGRFGVGDADLMPPGTNVRNGIIRAAEAILGLWRKNKEPNEPTNTMVPVKVSNKFEKSFAVDPSVKRNTEKVGIEAGQKAQDNVIIPRRVDPKKRDDPVAPEEH